jgi:hypothetical protein
MTAKFIPNTTGLTMIELSLDEEDGTLSERHLPIVGWEIADDAPDTASFLHASPVTIVPPLGFDISSTLFHRRLDGFRRASPEHSPRARPPPDAGGTIAAP